MHLADGEMPSCQLETCVNHATCFCDRPVKTDMLLQVRYSCGEGGQEAIVSIKVHCFIVPGPRPQCRGLPAGPFCLLS